MIIVRTKEEVDRILNICDEVEASGNSKYPGMTFEQGVSEMTRWLVGECDENPLLDE